MEPVYGLDTIPLFSHLRPEQLAVLEAAAVRQVFRAGELIFRHGDPPEYLYVVESGGVDIVLESQSDEIILASFTAGSFFGELAVFDGQPRNATARATEETSLVCVSGKSVNDLVERSPAAARQLMSAVAQRLRGANELLSRLQIRNANEAMDERMTFGERVADMVARFGGSWTFLIIFAMGLFGWMGVNTALVLTHPVDPYPFIFLNLMLSCLAAVQAPIIMMSQNRQSFKDRLSADLDFQVNIKAEHAVQQLNRKVDELRALILQEREARRSRG
jgi:CRP/FNR family cyclic AMP-dependent transcriptional regulator